MTFSTHNTEKCTAASGELFALRSGWCLVVPVCLNNAVWTVMDSVDRWLLTFDTWKRKGAGRGQRLGRSQRCNEPCQQIQTHQGSHGSTPIMLFAAYSGESLKECGYKWPFEEVYTPCWVGSQTCKNITDNIFVTVNKQKQQHFVFVTSLPFLLTSTPI